MTIDQQNVQNLLIGSSFLQLQKVKDACCSFLQERSDITPVPAPPRPSQAGSLTWIRSPVCRLHPKNCLGVRQFAETMMCTGLYDRANHFLQQHFVEASLSEEFLGLRGEELLELLGCEQLHIKAEEQVGAPGQLAPPLAPPTQV